MFCDFHSHVLPGIDDGAKDVDMALKMLALLHKQGTDTVVATPHYYAHRQSVEDFCVQRQAALEQVVAQGGGIQPKIVLGAEVYLEQGLRHKDLRPLCYGGTSYILIELPYSSFKSWMLEEVYHVCLQQSLTPVFAHLDRYVDDFSRDDIQQVLDFDEAVIQVNSSALFSHKSLKTVLGWIKSGVPIVLGSDCHNLSSRAPDNDHAQSVLKAKLGKTWLNDYRALSEQLLGDSL